QMCGNGVRCVAKYIYDYGITNNKAVSIETLAGIKKLELMVENGIVKEVKVNMGKPGLRRDQIPMVGEDSEVINEALKIDSNEFKITCVSMGNPHCVIFVDDVCNVPLTEYGPLIENHDLFPERINVHFVQVIKNNKVKMKTWERGSGVTLACGTGASAVCVAGVLNKKTDPEILAHLPGGDLKLEWAQDENVYMTGPATESFKGEWDLTINS
ncbi:MAG: diaminopimelate epimerase, partial [Candidatus Anammoxibacter sp.]